MAREISYVVTKAQLQEIIPRFGLPQNIQSDNGSAFTSQIF